MFEHGTLNGYGNRKCRCQPCRDANAAAQRERRARYAETNFEGRTHGNYSLYSMGCRCGACSAAFREWSARRRARRVLPEPGE